MNRSLIPLLAEAIQTYVPARNLFELGEIFSTDIPREEQDPNYLQLAATLISRPEHGSNREFLNALVQLVLSRNDERRVHTGFDEQYFHETFGTRMQALSHLVGDQMVQTSVTVQEDQPFSAKSEARDLLGKAETLLTVVDVYIGIGTLDCLRDVQHPIRILTGNKDKSIENGFERSLKDFRGEGYEVEVKTHSKLHDRYLLFNERCWLVGSSLKDAGKKTFNILEIGDFRAQVQAEVDKKWNEGSVVLQP